MLERPLRRPPDPPLADEAVLLRVPGEADAPAIAAACRDPEIGRWVPIPIPYTLADAHAFLEVVADGWADGAHATFAIEDRASGALVGLLGLDRGRVPGRASVGYWLAPEARGRGFATRAVRLVAGWAFEDPRLDRLELMTLVGNAASGRVAERAGFRREGILRRYLPFRERLEDAVMFAMTREDAAGPGPGSASTAGPPVTEADDPLARVPLFADLDAAELARVRDVATEVAVEPGSVLLAEGDPGDALYVVLEGTFDVTKRAGDGEIAVATVGPGEVQGEMAVLEGGARSATVRARTPARALRIGRDDLLALLARDPAVTTGLLRTIARRLRATEALLREREKLASLGTLSAGLAHELNNPAAAARSSATRLAGALDDADRAAAALGALGTAGGPPAGPVTAELLDAVREEVARRAADPPIIDPLDAMDRRDAVATLLGDLGMADPHEPAAALVALGWDGNELDDLLGPFESDEARLVVGDWLAALALVRQLLAEVGLAAERISEIVGAVREYTYLDRAPVQKVTVTAGLENTLVILRARWKAGVAIERAYASGLPQIEAFGSELNQVWTNLIGNAIDAMDGQGTLGIAADPTPAGGVAVTICDSGPGIPAGTRERIFDPFFTTKEIGVGTGLGLHISRSIVERHGGRLELLSSEAGRTCFRATLPPRLPAPSPTDAAPDAPDPAEPGGPGR